MAKTIKTAKKGLTTAERLAVWFGLLFINAIVTFVICLLLWRDKDAAKWSDFVGIMKWFFGIFIGLALLGFITAFALVAVNPKAQIQKARQMKYNSDVQIQGTTPTPADY